MDNIYEQLEEHHKDAFVWALTCTRGDEAEAEDILQTVYIKILDKKAVYSNRSTFRTWLYAVIRNTAVQHRRKQAYRNLLALKWHVPEANSKSPVDSLEEREAGEYLKDALQQLSGRQKEILELVFYHDLTIEETSEVLGISVGTARTHYHRGKHKFQQILDSQEHIWPIKITSN